MSHKRHHSIVITSPSKGKIKKAHTEAQKIFPYVSEICPVVINGYLSFYIPPDGSVNGAGDSIEGNERRNKFIKWMLKNSYKDGSSPWDWAEVVFGDDHGFNSIIRNDQNPYRTEKEYG